MKSDRCCYSQNCKETNNDLGVCLFVFLLAGIFVIFQPIEGPVWTNVFTSHNFDSNGRHTNST